MPSDTAAASTLTLVMSVRDDECGRMHCVVRITAVLISFARLTTASITTQHINGICNNNRQQRHKHTSDTKLPHS